MHVTIDRSYCLSCGACWNSCPEVFDQNPCDGFAEIVESCRFNHDRADGFIPEDLAACAQEAAGLCPAGIITVEHC